MTVKRPRVAAIGLDSLQIESIVALCGDLRRADSLEAYRKQYSWTETDVAVLGSNDNHEVTGGVHLLTVGSMALSWLDKMLSGSIVRRNLQVTPKNTEREVSVAEACPVMFQTLATDLSGQLGHAEDPPSVITTGYWPDETSALIQTTSGKAVAHRLVLKQRPRLEDGGTVGPVALVLPAVKNLSAWFRAFLTDIHNIDSARVPQAPPRLTNPSDWYTPQERKLAEKIETINRKMERLDDERQRLKDELTTENEHADVGIRRAVWADGDNLVASVEEILRDLGFEIKNMDTGLKQGEPKREDLRLTLPGRSDWEAIVEVKGYTRGTKTNDARQIREHRENYVIEEGRTPDLTLWIANSHRTTDPSDRPRPDSNVQDAVEMIGAVHVLASDLYKQWALAAAGTLELEDILQSLTDAVSGLWDPMTLDRDA